MSITVAPLDKQLVTLDLSKGMDERSRPELMSGFTTIENMVQDHTGAWTKRPGQLLALTADATGGNTYPVYPRKILNLVNGWGVMANPGRLLHKQDTQAKFRQRQRLALSAMNHGMAVGA